MVMTVVSAGPDDTGEEVPLRLNMSGQAVGTGEPVSETSFEQIFPGDAGTVKIRLTNTLDTSPITIIRDTATGDVKSIATAAGTTYYTTAPDCSSVVSQAMAGGVMIGETQWFNAHGQMVKYQRLSRQDHFGQLRRRCADRKSWSPTKVTYDFGTVGNYPTGMVVKNAQGQVTRELDFQYNNTNQATVPSDVMKKSGSQSVPVVGNAKLYTH